MSSSLLIYITYSQADSTDGNLLLLHVRTSNDLHLLLLHVARLPVPPPTPPHVHVAPGHPSPEEHVENFFCRHITLKKRDWLQC